MLRSLALKDTKAVSLMFATVFFFYFSSEMLLRQYVLGKMTSKDMDVNKILSRLPHGIREKVRVRITKGRLKDQLAAAKTDGQYISIRIALASMETEKEMEQACFEISQGYPNNPESISSFLFFFRGRSPLRQISVGEYHDFILRLPELNRVYAWEGGLNKLKGTGASRREIIEFLHPLLNIEPNYKDYMRLYVELAESALQEDADSIENRSRKLKEACEKLPTIEQVQSRMMKEEGEKGKKDSK